MDQINPNNLHHGYLIVGDRETTRPLVFNFLEKTLQIETTGNPDFSFIEYNTLTIDDARLLAETQQRKAFANDIQNKPAKKFFVFAVNIITDEAQNALLKVFEEPTPGTHFFILASQNTFLPTFLSRLERIEMRDERDEIREGILIQSIPERLALVGKLAGDISDEKKVKQDAIDLLNQIENELFVLGVEKNFQALKECQFARTALMSRGAMTKMILENLMLQI